MTTKGHLFQFWDPRDESLSNDKEDPQGRKPGGSFILVALRKVTGGGTSGQLSQSASGPAVLSPVV